MTMTLTPQELCNNKIARSSATFFYSPNGVNGYKYNDVYYSEREFAECFPTNPLKVKMPNEKGFNSDRTKAWME